MGLKTLTVTQATNWCINVSAAFAAFQGLKEDFSGIEKKLLNPCDINTRPARLLLLAPPPSRPSGVYSTEWRLRPTAGRAAASFGGSHTTDPHA